MEEKLPRALPRDVPGYHTRQASHFRALALNTTSCRAKARLLEEAEEHEQMARSETTSATEQTANSCRMSTVNALPKGYLRIPVRMERLASARR
jgi:hypothetical protein